MTDSHLEATLDFHIRAVGLPAPVREYRFHETRKWRFDFAWPNLRVAAEVEGGTGRWAKSRHTSPKGFEDDCSKYNAATIAHWYVLRFTGAMVEDGRALTTIEDMLRTLGVKKEK